MKRFSLEWDIPTWLMDGKVASSLLRGSEEKIIYLEKIYPYTCFSGIWYVSFYKCQVKFDTCPARQTAYSCDIFVDRRPSTVAMTVLVVVEMFNALNNLSENQSLLWVHLFIVPMFHYYFMRKRSTFLFLPKGLLCKIAVKSLHGVIYGLLDPFA